MVQLSRTKEYRSQWFRTKYASDPEFRSKHLQNSRNWKKSNIEKIKLVQQEYYQNHKEIMNNQSKKNGPGIREKLRFQVLNHYSNGKLECACCGEKITKFLTIDHINNNGNRERAELNLKAGCRFYAWLRRNNYPEGYQVLCMNCNFGKRMNNGICPHKLGGEDNGLY